MRTKTFVLFGYLTFLNSCIYVNQQTNQGSEEEDNIGAWADEIKCVDGWEKFANGYFSICFPDDWTVNNSGTFGSELVLTSPQIEIISESRPFTQNINVMKQPESSVLDYDINNLDEYARFNKEQLEKVLFQTKILSFSKTMLSGVPAYRNRMTANQNGADLYFEQYMFQGKKHYFILTFTAPIEASEESIALGSKIMNTLHVAE